MWEGAVCIGHLKGAERVPDEGVLAFYLARAYWGRGLATEAGALLWILDLECWV